MEITRYKRNEDVVHAWYHIDATGKNLGRLATQVANLLRGKNKADYTPSVDCGDYVIITNAHKIEMTGKKWESKEYYHYSGYQSGLKITTAEQMLVKHPTHIVEHAVRDMLPKNRLARQVIKKLKVYASDTHPHGAQQVKTIEV